MATARRTEKPSETPIRRSLRCASKPKTQTPGSSKSSKSKDFPVFKESTSDQTSDDDMTVDELDEDFPANSSMSLDVLARVATETLEKATKFKESNPQKKMVPRKAANTTDRLNLKQIRKLPAKSLVYLFSELSSNELARNFTYTCSLMPGTCNEKFTSFGNESRARSQVHEHLVRHLEQLCNDRNDKATLEFTAETVEGRRRRLQAMDTNTKKNRRNVQLMKTKNVEYTVIKPHKEKVIKLPRNKLTNLGNFAIKTAAPRKYGSRKSPARPQQPSATQSYLEYGEGIIQHDMMEIGHDEMTVVPGEELELVEVKDEAVAMTLYQSEAERRIEENEQFIIDLLSRSQPHHDHAYTTIFGKKRGAAQLEDTSYDEEAAEVSTEDAEAKSKPALPMLLFSCDLVPPPDIGPIASQEVIIDEVLIPVSLVGWADDAPYPPMPKVAIPKLSVTKRGRPLLAEKEVRTPVLMVKKKTENLGTSEWERRMALRCINELRGKRKDDEPLACKICTDRIFTAAATLTYHYRSHAGIKPFVCLICNTTFTRQHSLNYHMLIHNNQSRFTCKDCGRRFRHPSHFKEHLRRHTGETPFECVDCRQRFKTRNTFKRHLKTRHGKLLTADGIHYLTEDEFLRVRTIPKRNLTESIIYFESDSAMPQEVASEEEVEERLLSVSEVESPVRVQHLFSAAAVNSIHAVSVVDDKTILMPIINI